MDITKTAIKTFVHPLWMLKDGKLGIYRYLNYFEKSQYYPAEQIREIQMARLKKLVEHAYTNCPFYTSRLDTVGMHPSDLNSFEDFTHIPFLTKSDIQENLQTLTAKNYKLTDLVANKTGGSTGHPIQFYHDKERFTSMDASAIRHDRWAGYDIGDKFALIWGHRDDISNFSNLVGKIKEKILLRSKVLDSSSMSHENMGGFAQELRSFQPRVILAYANAMHLFALFCRERDVVDIRPKAIITTAEVLHGHQRKEIEEVFGCQVFNRYGCREVSVVASECEEHDGMHINADALYVEIIRDDGRTAQPGETGNVIISDLYNYGMPFIRYKIEDMGALTDKRCSCGRGLPLMDMMAGRVTDFLFTPDGTRVSGAALTIYVIANTPGVKQAQLVQETKDSLTIKIVQAQGFNDDSLAFLNKKIKEFFGDNMNWQYEFVEEIPKEASGKYRFSICNVPQHNQKT